MREQLCCSFRRYQVTARREQVNADQRSKNAADEKEKSNRDQVQKRDALMVGG